MLESRSFKPISGDWDGLEETIFELESVSSRRHAADYHDAVALHLEECGWKVRREYAVVTGDGHGGRVDIVAAKNFRRIALELDNRTPRGRSIIKLQSFPSHVATAVLLRRPR